MTSTTGRRPNSRTHRRPGGPFTAWGFTLPAARAPEIPRPPDGPGPRGGRRRRAFTLLELIMVLVTLCVAAAMAAPTLSGFGQGRRIGACASQVLSLARFARTQAVTRATLYRLNVDPAAETFWLTTQDNSGQFVSPGDESGRVFKAPPGVRLDWIGPASEDGKSCYVEFLPTGRCDAATIRLTDARGVVTDVTCPSAAEQFKVVARGGGAG